VPGGLISCGAPANTHGLLAWTVCVCASNADRAESVRVLSAKPVPGAADKHVCERLWWCWNDWCGGYGGIVVVAAA
jgi:hypothetical protein